MPGLEQIASKVSSSGESRVLKITSPNDHKIAGVLIRFISGTWGVVSFIEVHTDVPIQPLVHMEDRGTNVDGAVKILHQATAASS